MINQAQVFVTLQSQCQKLLFFLKRKICAQFYKLQHPNSSIGGLKETLLKVQYHQRFPIWPLWDTCECLHLLESLVYYVFLQKRNSNNIMCGWCRMISDVSNGGSSLAFIKDMKLISIL